MPRLVHYIRGKNDSSRQRSYETQNSSQKYANNKLGTMAKYMGPGVVSTVSNEHLELHSYTSDCEQGRGLNSDGILKTTRVEQSVLKPGV
jgi:hypothetical protein